jgi:hypothetical protein
VTDFIARVRFLSRLEAAEAALAVRDFDALDRLVCEISPLVEFVADDDLLARWSVVFAAADPELR